MDELNDALAIALEAIEEHGEEIANPILARRVQSVRTAIEELVLHLDSQAQLTG